MDAARYAQVRSVFMEACELLPEARRVYLERRCRDDIELRREVEALLELDEQSAGDHEESLARLADRVQSQLDAVVEAEMALPPATEIARYRIVRLLGTGGMGSVYEATQDHPRRTVALKLIRPEMVTEMMLRRFEYEAHVLGLLQHPGIAQIHDAGTAEVGRGVQPYFAMELVRGRTLLEHVTDASSVRERLELVARMCDAIHHAHTRGVVHRDLKPGNVLVDESGQPKILDFGVARITDADIHATTLHTSPGELLGTIPYMSPEQAGGSSDEVDTRSDVYALGVILFELLCGHLPHDLSDAPLHEAVRMIREEPPAPLSSFDRSLRGDLETIVATALAKDKTRRYQTALELAGDIRRYLGDEPIVARPPSALYQLRKFAKRNKVMVSGVFATALAIVVGGAGTAYGMFRAQHALDDATTALQEAQVARDEAMAVEGLLTNMMQLATPEGQGADVRVKDVLEILASVSSDRLQSQPRVAARLERMLGACYVSLDLREKARVHLERALSMSLAHVGEMDPLTLGCRQSLAELAVASGESDAAIEQLQAVLELQERVLGPNHDDSIATMVLLARALGSATRLTEAGQIASEAIRRSAAVPGFALNATPRVRLDLAAAFLLSGRLTAAEEQLSELVVAESDRYTRLRTVLLRSELAASLGDHNRELALLVSALPISQGLLGSDSLRMAEVRYRLARAQMRHGATAEAESNWRESLRILNAQLPKHDRAVLQAMDGLALTFINGARLEEAEELLEQAISICEETYGTQDPLAMACRHDLGMLRLQQGRFTEAVGILVSQTEWVMQLGASDPTRGYHWLRLGIAHTHAGSLEEAQDALERAAVWYDRFARDSDPRGLSARMYLARVRCSLGDEGRGLRDASQMIEEAMGWYEPGSPTLVWLLIEEGELLMQTGRFDEARSLFWLAEANQRLAPRLHENRIKWIAAAIDSTYLESREVIYRHGPRPADP